MAKSDLRNKAIRLLERTDEILLTSALAMLGWTSGAKPNKGELGALLIDASNAVVQQVIESLSSVKGEGKTASPRQLDLSKAWTERLGGFSYLSSCAQFKKAEEVIKSENVWNIDFGKPLSWYNRFAMYIAICETVGFDPIAAKISGLTTLVFNAYIKRYLLKAIIALRIHDLYKDYGNNYEGGRYLPCVQIIDACFKEKGLLWRDTLGVMLEALQKKHPGKYSIALKMIDTMADILEERVRFSRITGVTPAMVVRPMIAYDTTFESHYAFMNKPR